jgi:5S rRNA maturation endonuclease (ribonuclease M5)
MFGSSLSDRQKILLDGSGAMNIIILTDNDDAGDKAAKIIEEKCKNTYKVKRISITKSDVAEMTKEEINNQIKRFL